MVKGTAIRVKKGRVYEGYEMCFEEWHKYLINIACQMYKIPESALDAPTHFQGLGFRLIEKKGVRVRRAKARIAGDSPYTEFAAQLKKAMEGVDAAVKYPIWGYLDHSSKIDLRGSHLLSQNFRYAQR
jgi:hypothetical protein